MQHTKEPAENTLIALLERSTALFPEKTAMHSAEGVLSFADYWRWSDKIAGHVAANLGDARGERVCVLVNSDLASMAAMLGLIKAGCIVVALGPNDPPAYRRAIVRDADARLILTTATEWDAARELAGDRAGVINCEIDCLDDHPPPEHQASPDDLLWIVYTSGSTGMPKGVVHSHRSVLSFLSNYLARTRLHNRDRVAKLHYTRAMDSLAALTVGASTFSWSLSQSGFVGIGQWLMTHRISLVPTIPTALRYMVQELRRTNQDLAVRLLRLSGEALHADDIRQAASVFPDSCEILNWYGSTEAAVATHVLHMRDRPPSPIPAGRVLDGLEVRIDADDTAATAEDRVGEIVVGGEALFDGYWRRPDLNKSRLHEDPDNGKRRWFRTGDKGFLDAAGRLYVLGRCDEQFKVKGYRVEPAEIEAALRRVDDIHDAVVTLVDIDQSPTPEALIAAYIMTRQPEPPPVVQIRRQLLQYLPVYMVPSYFVLIDAVPRLVSGKPDRRALPPFVPRVRSDYNEINTDLDRD